MFFLNLECRKKADKKENCHELNGYCSIESCKDSEKVLAEGCGAGPSCKCCIKKCKDDGCEATGGRVVDSIDDCNENDYKMTNYTTGNPKCGCCVPKDIISSTPSPDSSFQSNDTKNDISFSGSFNGTNFTSSGFWNEGYFFQSRTLMQFIYGSIPYGESDDYFYNQLIDLKGMLTNFINETSEFLIDYKCSLSGM